MTLPWVETLKQQIFQFPNGFSRRWNMLADELYLLINKLDERRRRRLITFNSLTDSHQEEDSKNTEEAIKTFQFPNGFSPMKS